MYTYFFQLGTTTELSLAELACVLGDKKLDILTQQIIAVNSATKIDVQGLQNQLGGCVKILKKEALLNDTTAQTIATSIAQIIPEGKITFAFTQLDLRAGETSDEILLDAAEIKKELVQQGRSVRFVEGKKFGLSAAVLLHQKKVREFVLIITTKEIMFAQTMSIQNIDDWTVRDRSKPYADRKKGMLPPKVARILLNINRSFDQATERVVLDPFCGAGNILLENAMLKTKGIGIDIDKNAVAGTTDNLRWFSETYQQPHHQQVYPGDATHVPESIVQAVTAIVTEPFLGRPKPKAEQVPDIFRGLYKLYLGAFKNWKKILPDGAPVTIVFPSTLVAGKEYTMSALIDKLLPLGYTTVSGPLRYSRPDAIITRSIYTFVLKK